MKKLIFILLMCSIYTTSVIAQGLLTSTNWKSVSIDEGNDGAYMLFDKTTSSNIIIKEGKESAKNTRLYYVSNSIDQNFNPEKVGKLNKGKYLVFYESSPDEEDQKNLREYMVARKNGDDIKIKEIKNKMNSKSNKDRQDVMTKRNLNSNMPTVYEIKEITPKSLILEVVSSKLWKAGYIMQYKSSNVKLE